MSLEEVRESKQPQVEIDTDDVNEQSVEVAEETKEESKEPNLNVGEVDLGYQSHGEEKEKLEVEQAEEPQQEVKEEKKPENLQEFSEGVKKRIDKLTKNWREAERREKAALEYAKGLQKKYDGAQTQFNANEEEYLKEFDARVDAQREQVKIKLRDAIENNDADKVMEANDELTRLAVEKEKARLKMQDRESRIAQAKEESETQTSEAAAQQQNLQQEQPEPSDKAKAWASKNTWFGNDKVMTNAAFTIHEDLVAMGIDVESEEYYNEVDNRMRENFPHKFSQEQQKKPVQTVASAGRKQQGRKTVRLTKSQVAIAKKLGVPLDEYAKYVKGGE